jgi:Fic family protein
VANQIAEAALVAIEDAVRRHPGGASAREVLHHLEPPVPLRTLQYRLRYLVTRKRLVKDGEGRWARYRLPETRAEAAAAPIPETDQPIMRLSPAATRVRDHVRQRPETRRPVGYDRGFLEGYRPNVTFYLTPAERAHLADVGTPRVAEQPAGTYARQILDRLLIDLAWNSSRLEGNTYSLLDTRRLIELGGEAEGGAPIEAQMILNHKDAIEFLVSAADDIGFNRYTVLNLHALLANNLLADPAAAGRLRYVPVAIERSSFHPLEVPQLIEECFEQVLATAHAITDPFEQALFIMVQLPYLQPFDDVNKRVSRLAANIPLIRRNLCPLSFVDVPRDTYTEAMLGVYEMNAVELLKEVFIWACERSAARYSAVRQSLGDPDPFRLRYRSELRELVGELIRARTSRKETVARIAAWSTEKIDAEDRARFVQIVESEIANLHEGNFARYRVRPSEFAEWRRGWASI